MEPLGRTRRRRQRVVRLVMTRNHTSSANRADQKAAMRTAFDACCGDASACRAWREKDDDAVPTDACHVRGNVCDEYGALAVVNLADFGLTCDLAILVDALAAVLGTATRFDVSSNPGLTTGADPNDASRTPASTLAALLRATAPNVTHVVLEANGNLFDGSATDASRRSETTFTAEVCSAFRARASTLATFKARNTGLKGAFPVNEQCLLGAASVRRQDQRERAGGRVAVAAGGRVSVFAFFPRRAKRVRGDHSGDVRVRVSARDVPGLLR